MSRSTKNKYGRYKNPENKVRLLPPSNTLSTLGLVGNEVEIPSPSNTVCSLCLREIHKGDPCIKTPAENKVFYVHADCVIAEMTRAHVSNLPKKKNKRKVQDPKPKSGIQAHCTFCRKLIGTTEQFIKERNKYYHYDNGTKNTKSCWDRYKRVRNSLSNSLRRGG